MGLVRIVRVAKNLRDCDTRKKIEPPLRMLTPTLMGLHGRSLPWKLNPGGEHFGQDATWFRRRLGNGEIYFNTVNGSQTKTTGANRSHSPRVSLAQRSRQRGRPRKDPSKSSPCAAATALRNRRIAAGIKLTWIAEECGVGKSYLSMMENGHRKFNRMVAARAWGIIFDEMLSKFRNA